MNSSLDVDDPTGELRILPRPIRTVENVLCFSSWYDETSPAPVCLASVESSKRHYQYTITLEGVRLEDLANPMIGHGMERVHLPMALCIHAHY